MKNSIYLKQLINLKNIFPIKKIQIYNNELVFFIDFVYLTQTLLLLKNHVNFQFKILVLISGVDYIKKKKRFEIIYELLSIHFNNRLKIKISLNELISVKSVEKLFLSANWFEREIFDMFGLYFDNHTNLKRILTDYGFEGYPLRKDFPLNGYVEIKYDNKQKKIVNEYIELAQEFRTFDYLTPWIE